MSSFTMSQSATFTITHARHMAAKVSTDLKRMQRFYGYPSDADIAEYEAEAAEMIRAGYFGTLTIGFVRDEQWIEPTLRYTARDLAGMSANDDDPGRVRTGCDISRATFHNHLSYTPAWHALSDVERGEFRKRLPFSRTGATERTINGYLVDDKTYSSGGRALNRSSVKGY